MSKSFKSDVFRRPREYLDELEQGWNEEMMGSFDLVPVYYCGCHMTEGIYVTPHISFDYVSNSIVIDC